jgi:hypothetical protein
LHGFHKGVAIDLGKELGLADDACIGKEDIQSAVLGYCFVDDRCQGLFVRGIK